MVLFGFESEEEEEWAEYGDGEHISEGFCVGAAPGDGAKTGIRDCFLTGARVEA